MKYKTFDEWFSATRAAPENAGVSDQHLIQYYLENYGYRAPQEEEAPRTERTWGEAFSDVGAGFAEGAGRAVENIGTIGQMVTGERNVLQDLGGRAAEYWQDQKSDILKQKQQDAAQRIEAVKDEGLLTQFWTGIYETAKDPALLTNFLAENIAMMVGPAGVGRLAGAGAKAMGLGATAAGTVATGGMIGGGAAMQGADVAGDTYARLKDIPKELWPENPDYQALTKAGMSHEEAVDEIALGLARQAGVAGGAASVASQFIIPGGAGRTLERVLAGAAGKPISQGGLKEIAKQATRAYFGESGQEAIEEGSGRLFGNIAVQKVDPEQSLTEGVGTQAGQGAVLGGFLGAPAGAVQGMQNNEVRRQAEEIRRLKEASDKIAAARSGDEMRAAAAEVLLKDIQNPALPAPTTIMSETDSGLTPNMVAGAEGIRPERPTDLVGLPDARIAAARLASPEAAADVAGTLNVVPESGTVAPESGTPFQSVMTKTGSYAVERTNPVAAASDVSAFAESVNGTIARAIEELRAKGDAKSIKEAIRLQSIGQFTANPAPHEVVKGGSTATGFGRLFGVDVRFFTSDSPLSANGAVVTMPDGRRVMFINSKSKSPVMEVFGHEITHIFKRDAAAAGQPELYQEFLDAMKPFIPDGMTNRLGVKYGALGIVDEEVVADLSGSVWTNESFYEKLANEKPDVFRRVVDAIRRFIASFRASISSGTAPIVPEVVKNVDQIEAIVAKYAAKHQDLISSGALRAGQESAAAGARSADAQARSDAESAAAADAAARDKAARVARMQDAADRYAHKQQNEPIAEGIAQEMAAGAMVAARDSGVNLGDEQYGGPRFQQGEPEHHAARQPRNEDGTFALGPPVQRPSTERGQPEDRGRTSDRPLRGEFDANRALSEGVDRKRETDADRMRRGGWTVGTNFSLADRSDFTRENIEGITQKDGWAILTGENPNNTEASDEQNVERTKELRARLREDKIDFIEVRGRYSESDRPEERSFIVFADKERAMALGVEFGQESILTREGLVYQSGKVDKATGKVNVFDTIPENYYTRIPGQPWAFSVDIDFSVAAKEGAETEFVKPKRKKRGEAPNERSQFADEPGTITDKKTISTRYATKPTIQEADPDIEPMHVSLKAAFRGGLKAGLARSIRSFETFKVDRRLSDDKLIESFVEHLKRNLMWLYDRVPAETREKTRQWYIGANKYANKLAESYGVSDMQAAAVIARLSPQNDWFNNIWQAREVISFFKDEMKRSHRWDLKMEQKAKGLLTQTGARVVSDAIISNLRGKSFNQIDDSVDAAWFLRIYSETYSDRTLHKMSPDGEIGDVLTSADGSPEMAHWNNARDLSGAIRILRDGSHGSISANMGQKHKIRSFYNNIISPNDEYKNHVTIDTHAVSAAHLMPFSSNSHEVMQAFGGSTTGSGIPKSGASGITGVDGTYPLYHEAYVRAAKELGVLPRELQSITWEEVRELFHPDVKDQMYGAVAANWERHVSGKITEEQARDGIWETADEFTSGKRSNQRVAEGEQAGADTAELGGGELGQGRGIPDAGRAGGGAREVRGGVDEDIPFSLAGPAEPAVRPGREGSVSAVGVHFGREPNLPALSGSAFGRGIKGREQERLARAADPRIKRRIYFYVTPSGQQFDVKRREAGLGPHIYRADLSNLYESGVSPKLEYQRAYTNEEFGILDEQENANRFESAVLDAGYDGYLVRRPDIAVVLNKDIPVKFLGTVGQEPRADLQMSVADDMRRGDPDLALSLTTPAVRRWMGGSKLVHGNGAPYVAYHGTLGNITEFDPEVLRDESYFGPGIYLTSDPEDASRNYANVSGPDVMARIDVTRDEVEQELGEVEDIDRVVMERLRVDNEGNVMPLFVRMTKPAVLGDNGYLPETRFDYSERTALKIRDALLEAASKYDANQRDLNKAESEMLERLLDGVSLNELLEVINSNIDWVEDENGAPAIGRFRAEFIRNLGFDGIVDTLVGDRFRFDPPLHGVTHYVVFNGTQVKSAIGNRGTFSRKSTRIDFSLDESMDDSMLPEEFTGLPLSPDEQAKAMAEAVAKDIAKLRKGRELTDDDYRSIGADWRRLSADPKAFSYGISDSLDLEGIVKDIGGDGASVRTEEADDNDRVYYSGRMFVPTRVHHIDLGGTSPVAKVYEDRNGRLALNVSQFRQGRDLGGMVYQIVGTWAANSGRSFIGDPAGLTTRALFRRTAQMFSNALRTGQTTHLEPHFNQKLAGLKWKKGDDDFNLGQMAVWIRDTLVAYAPETYFAKDRAAARDRRAGGFRPAAPIDSIEAAAGQRTRGQVAVTDELLAGVVGVEGDSAGESIGVRPRLRTDGADVREMVGGVLYSLDQPFYSALRSEIEKVSSGAAPAAGWKSTIKGLINKGAIKADEVEWTGINDWLDLQGKKVTKAQVLDFLDANGVHVATSIPDSAQPQPGFDITPAMQEKAAGGLPLFSLAEGYEQPDKMPGLRDFLRSTGNPGQAKQLFERLPVMQMVGNAKLIPGTGARVAISRQAAQHILRDHPEMDVETLASALESIDEPRAVIVAGKTDRGEGLAFVTKYRANDGSPIVVVARAGAANKEMNISTILSAYGRTKSADWVARAIEGDGVAYADEKERGRLSQLLRRVVLLSSRRGGRGLSPRREGRSATPKTQYSTLSNANLEAYRKGDSGWNKGKMVVEPSKVDEVGAEFSIAGDSARDYTPEQREMFRRTGRDVERPTIKQRVEEVRRDFWGRMRQGLFDQFDPLKKLSDKAYTLMRLSRGSTGAVEALLKHGLLDVEDGVTVSRTQDGGFIQRVGSALQGEMDDFLWWIAANRAEQLTKEEREHLFTAQDIAAGKSLASGEMRGDYVLQHGPRKGSTTRSRSEAYDDALKTYNEFSRNVLDVAQASGLIDGESRQYWERSFYVPFYRESEERGFIGANIKNGAVRQKAFERLKGGKQKLNNDLLHNVLMNWAHLIDASAKNRAALAAALAAVDAGVAIESSETAIREMGRSLEKRDQTFWVMDQGRKRYFLVDDKPVMEALLGLEFAGMRGPIMDAMSKLKLWLTIGVTASPAFKIRNLIRDSVQAVAVSDLGYNPFANVAQGLKAGDRSGKLYVDALASGALIRFGTMVEGSQAARTRQLMKLGMKESQLLDSESKLRAFWDTKLEPLLTAYNELGNRGEEVNRMALYQQLLDKGVSKAEAALQARDLMDFSMQGRFSTVRFLTQVVPFLNARLQGMYKLGRGTAENPKKAGAILAATAMASLALLAAYHDDDDWKKREDWDRDNYWWFKFGGVAYRIPKPFEIGAIATIAERGAEMFFDPEQTGGRATKQIMNLISNQLAINPVPQAVKPILDIYANRDSFTGRPIESMGDERLRADYRFNARTTMLARGVSSVGQGALRATGMESIGLEFLSPKQIDHLIKGYTAWLGTFLVAGTDIVLRPATGQIERPDPDYWRKFSLGFIQSVPADQSKYITRVYDQLEVVEKAFGTYRGLIKEGRTAEAAEFAKDNAEDLRLYRQATSIKQAISKINQQIRMIERSNLSGAEKRDRIAALAKQKDTIARRLK